MSAPPPTLALDEQLCFSLYGAAMAINRAYKPLLDELQITYPQYLVLSTLWECDGLSIGAIAERLALDASTITPLVKRLETADLLQRKRNPLDERKVIVSLTDHGRAMRERTLCLGEVLLSASAMPLARLRALNGEVRRFRDAVSAFVSS